MGVTVGFCNVDVKPSGPVHDHVVAPVEFAFSVAVLPAHTGPLLVGPADDGDEPTVTTVVYVVDDVQPLPGLPSVNEYVPAPVTVSVGFCNVDVKPPGPVHDHAVAPLELALNVTVPPAHTGPLFVAPLDVGAVPTVNADVLADVLPHAAAVAVSV